MPLPITLSAMLMDQRGPATAAAAVAPKPHCLVKLETQLFMQIVHFMCLSSPFGYFD